MMNWQVQNGLAELCFGGLTLRDVTLRAELADQGAVALAWQEPREEADGLHIPFTGGEMVDGELILRDLDGTLCVSLRAANRQLNNRPFRAFHPTESLTLTIGAIDGAKKLLASDRYKPFWVQPAFPAALPDIPDNTQQLLIHRGEEGMAFLMPVVARDFKTVLRGCAAGLEACLRTYLGGMTALEGPCLLVKAGEEPYGLIESVYEAAHAHGVIAAEPRKNKPYPAMMEKIGWCTWDAFYQDVNAQGILEKLQELKDKHVPLGWVLIDDGWSQLGNNRLCGLQTDERKFPGGLRPVIEAAKKDYGVGQVGVWRAFTGYWQGIEPTSALAAQMKEHLTPVRAGNLLPGFSYEQSYAFDHAWDDYMAGQGVDFIKVDNQSSAIHFVRDHAKVGAIGEMHAALEDSCLLHYPAPMINCMGLSSENIQNHRYSTVTRTSDDFIPGEEGSFAQHLMQNAYASVFLDPICLCDYDMWWTEHVSGVASGVLRAISGGPVYVSDRVGHTDPSRLQPLIREDGTIIRCDHAARPAASCLFSDARQGSGVIFLTNRCGQNAVTAAFNLTGEERAATLCREDTECEAGRDYLAYLHFAKKYVRFDRDIALTLPADGTEIVTFYPIENGRCVVGDEDKYISGGSGLNTKTITL